MSSVLSVLEHANVLIVVLRVGDTVFRDCDGLPTSPASPQEKALPDF
jgi:hypothetical protein